jgi:hypothetical protein
MPAQATVKPHHIMATCTLLVLCCAGSAVADNLSSHKQSGSVFAITFFSLKQGHSIGPAQLRLSDNGSLELTIAEETLSGQTGTFTIDGPIFTAATEFSTRQVRQHHYTLAFKGITLFNTYIAGTARLREYLDGNRFIQEALFLFTGSTKTADSDQEDGRLPF